MAYHYIKPVLFSLDDRQIKEELKEGESFVSVAARIICDCIEEQIIRKEDIKKNLDILYIAVFPEYTFCENNTLAVSKEEVTEIQGQILFKFNQFKNLLIIAGTVLWIDENKFIYNSALIFLGENKWIWDKLMPYEDEYKGKQGKLARWIEKEDLSFTYFPEEITFPMEQKEENNNYILKGWNRPEKQGNLIISVTKYNEENSILKITQAISEMCNKTLLFYTIEKRLKGSSLSSTAPLFPLTEKGASMLALDICKEHQIKTAKSYCEKMYADQIKLYILISSDIHYQKENVPLSSKVAIHCDKSITQACQVYYNNEICTPKQAEQNKGYIKLIKIYDEIPLEI